MGEIHVWLRGGLANQLFQYAFGRALAEQSDSSLKIRTGLVPAQKDAKGSYNRWPEQISSFCHFGEMVNDRPQPAKGRTSHKSKALTFIRRLSDSYPLLMAQLGFIGGDIYYDWGKNLEKVPKRSSLHLNGMFVDLKPIEAYREVLRTEIFDIRCPAISEQFISEVCAGRIAIHVRMGDFARLNHRIPEIYKKFYPKAISEMLIRKPEAKFLLFSDEPKTAAELLSASGLGNLDIEVFQDSGLRPIEVLYAMSSCSGIVAAKSSFAWWAAFLLRNKSHPVVFQAPWSTDERFTPSKKIFPSNWELIDID